MFESRNGAIAKKVVMLGFLTALYIVLERFLSFIVWNMRVGFAFIALAVAGMLYGPLPAGMVGAAGDVLGMLLFPTGPYFPGFTLTAFLTGAVYGIFLRDTVTTKKMVAAVAVNQLVLSLFVQTLWISITYGSPYLPLLPVRLTQCLIMIPVQLIALQVLRRPIMSAVKGAGLQ